MKWEDALLIIANQGEFKAFKIAEHKRTIQNEIRTVYTPELINEVDYIEAHKKLQDVVTDSAGRFGHSIGEEHELENERKRRNLSDIARTVENVVAFAKPEEIYLAFPQEYNAKLLSMLPADIRNKIVKNVPRDLVKTPHSELLEYFA